MREISSYDSLLLFLIDKSGYGKTMNHVPSLAGALLVMVCQCLLFCDCLLFKLSGFLLISHKVWLPLYNNKIPNKLHDKPYPSNFEQKAVFIGNDPSVQISQPLNSHKAQKKIILPVCFF